MKTVCKLANALLLAALLTACGSTITNENFTNIKDDMSREQVIALLGEPTTANSNSLAGLSAGNAEWTDGKNTISIQFFNGKVKLKRFYTHEEE